jgi:hypothetical protein
MTSAGANTWSVPLELNNLEAKIGSGGGGGGVSAITAGNANIVVGGTSTNPTISGTLTALTSNVATSNFSFSGNSGTNPSFVVGAGQNFRVVTTDLSPQIVVGSTGVALGEVGSGYTVTAPTPAVGNNSTQVATTAFVHRSQVNTLNFYQAQYQPTFSKQSIIYHNASTTITASTISAQLDALPATPVYLTYGADVPPLHVAVGQDTNSTIAVSTDGINWVKLGMQFSVYGNAVAYSPTLNRWVAVGNGTSGSIMYSNDGFTWVPVAGIFTIGNAVFWTGSRFLAGGTGKIATSTDGITWSSIGGIFTTDCYGFASNGEITIAVGGGTNQVAYSWDDGQTWTGEGNVLNGAGGSTGKCVCWTGSRFLAGIECPADPTIKYSYDGFIWTEVSPGGTYPFDSMCNSIAQNGQTIIAVGGYNAEAFFSQSGGTYWNALPTTVLDSLGFSVIWTGSLYLIGATGSNTIAYSQNGAEWVGLGLSVFDLSCRGIAFNGERPNRITFPVNTVVIGGGITNIMAYSVDNGVKFNTLTSPFTTLCNGLAYGAAKYVGVGQGGCTLAYSYNGKKWIANGLSIFSLVGRGVVYGSTVGRWVSVGNGTNSIASSTDGITFTGQGTTIFTQGNAVAFGNGYYVAGGQTGSNTIAFSASGTVFSGAGATVFTSACRAVAFSSTLNRFVLGGSGGSSLATSDNGTTFTAVSGSTSIFTTCTGIAYGNGIFLATGSGANVFASSVDGLTWTALGGSSVFSSGGQEIAYVGNSKWIALGSGGNTYAISTNNGVSWYAPPNQAIGSAGYAIAWNGNSVGASVIPSTSIVLNDTNNKKLDVIAPSYTAIGYSNLTLTIKT